MFQRQSIFLRGRQSVVSQTERLGNLFGRLAVGFAEPRRHGEGAVVGELAVQQRECLRSDGRGITALTRQVSAGLVEYLKHGIDERADLCCVDRAAVSLLTGAR